MDARGYGKLSRQLLTARPRGVFSTFNSLHGYRQRAYGGSGAESGWKNFNQSHVPLGSKLVRTLISTRMPTAAGRDPATTALCLRALLCCDGRGAGH